MMWMGVVVTATNCGNQVYYRVPNTCCEVNYNSGESKYCVSVCISNVENCEENTGGILG